MLREGFRFENSPTFSFLFFFISLSTDAFLSLFFFRGGGGLVQWAYANEIKGAYHDKVAA